MDSQQINYERKTYHLSLITYRLGEQKLTNIFLKIRKFEYKTDSESLEK